MLVFLDLFIKTMTDKNAFIIRFEEYKLNKECLYKLRKVFTLQRNQMSMFLELIHKNKLPEIICTDLNNNSFSDIYNFISKGRNDAFLENAPPPIVVISISGLRKISVEISDAHNRRLKRKVNH